jgi:hypothetical protein
LLPECPSLNRAHLLGANPEEIDMSPIVALIWSANIFACVGGTITIFGADRDLWADPRTKFRIVILGPLCANLGAGTLGGFITGHWIVAIACGAEYLLVCAIGSYLHPQMSAGDLRRGFRSVSARSEALSLPLDLKFSLINRACTQLAMLFFVDAVAVLVVRGGWVWYAAVAIGSIISTVTGGILKLAFSSARTRFPRQLPR